jgi:hypothetical protein
MNTGLTFTGNGELENGTTFVMTVTHADKAAYSAANILMTVPGLGSFKVDMGSGGSGLDRIDDMIPTAWEETNGTNVGTGLQTVSGVGGKANLEWSLEEGMFFPDGVSAHLAYSPRADGNNANDKATGGAGNGNGAGWDVVLQHSGITDGLNIFGGYSVIAREQDTSLNGGNKKGDKQSYALGATYAIGGATFGYQRSRDDIGAVSGTNYYENSAYGVSFSVNDNLSVSLGAHNSERNHASGTTTDNEAVSLQAAYTMGGASVKFARTSVDNADYNTAIANTRDGYSVALTLAF